MYSLFAVLSDLGAAHRGGTCVQHQPGGAHPATDRPHYAVHSDARHQKHRRTGMYVGDGSEIDRHNFGKKFSSHTWVYL